MMSMLGTSISKKTITLKKTNSKAPTKTCKKAFLYRNNSSNSNNCKSRFNIRSIGWLSRRSTISVPRSFHPTLTGYMKAIWNTPWCILRKEPFSSSNPNMIHLGSLKK